MRIADLVSANCKRNSRPWPEVGRFGKQRWVHEEVKDWHICLASVCQPARPGDGAGMAGEAGTWVCVYVL